MLMLSPVCHLHYFCLAVPLVMGLMGREWEEHGTARLSWALTVVLVANFVLNGSHALAQFGHGARPGVRQLRCAAALGSCDRENVADAPTSKHKPACSPSAAPASVEEVSQLPKAS